METARWDEVGVVVPIARGKGCVAEADAEEVLVGGEIFWFAVGFACTVT